MAKKNSPRSNRRFSIRRMEPGEQPVRPKRGRPSREAPREAKEDRPAPPQRRDDLTGGLFERATSLLACLGSVAGTGLTDAASIHRTSDDRWWTAMRAPAIEAAPLIVAAQGQTFGLFGETWAAVGGMGDILSGDDRQVVSPDTWPEATLADLVAETPLRRSHIRELFEIRVIMPPALGGWLNRRALSQGLDVEITRGQINPLSQPVTADTAAGVLQVRLLSEDRPLPMSLLHSVARLPGVVLGELVETGAGQVLLDAGHSLPLNPNLLAELVPDDETWMLGSPEVGHFRLTLSGDPVNGADLIESDESMEAPPLPIGTSETPELPTGPKVKLVNLPGRPSRVDAVLLNDSDLERVRIWLTGRSLGEQAFLFPGQDRYLLTAPGGLPGISVPFGIPLTRIGPGGLYVEMGCGFSPPVPYAARSKWLGMDDDKQSLVVMTLDGAWRFDEQQMTPAWILYVGDAPEIKSDISPRGQEILSRISDLWDQAEYQLELRRLMKASGIRKKRPKREEAPKSERPRLLERAQRLEHEGKLVEAAQLLEKAGLPGPAGRLYEQAAQQL